MFPRTACSRPTTCAATHATLPEAIAQDGWPTIDSVRGQVMFVMDNSGTFRDWYRTGHDALAGSRDLHQRRPR